ncbi:MAG: carbamoyltransferase HypF, partial [Acidobacteria bacterium]|nr:carbamoyltransferase HypF [Acidobacteriota bacterium]
QPLIEALLASHDSPTNKAAIFHNSLAESILHIAAAEATHQVLLTGGCFQNALLTEKTAARLRHAGFTVFTHQKLPPNDGAIAAGQLLASASRSAH